MAHSRRSTSVPWRIPTTLMALAIQVGLVADQSLAGGVIVSEFMAVNVGTVTDENGDFSDWIELYNPTDDSQNLQGWFLSDDAAELDKWQFPSVQITAHGFLTVFASGKDRKTGELHTNFKLSENGEFLALTNDRFELVTRFSPSYPRQFADVSYGFGMDLTTKTLVDAKSPVRYDVPVHPDDDSTWFLPTFPDTLWDVGTMPLGFDTSVPGVYGDRTRTDVREMMEGINSSLYVRIPFNVTAEDAREMKFVRGIFQYDDGIGVWVNGEFVGSNNSFSSLHYNSRARADRLPQEAATFEELRIANFDGFYEGTNILGVQVLNRHSRDRDLFMLCELEAVKVGAIRTPSPVYLDPTPRWPNGLGASRIAAKPSTSVECGVHYEEIHVELSITDPDANIRYTVDGSTPNEDSPLYSVPIRISKSTELRSRSFRSGRLGSPTLTSRYSVIAPESRVFNSNIPIVVLSTFGSPITTDDWTPCHLQIQEPGVDGRARFSDTPHHSSAGAIKIRGSSSADWPKRPYAIEIRDELGNDSDVPLLGMPPESDWILWPPYKSDPSLIRNAFAYGISNQIGHYSARTRFCEVYVNFDKVALCRDHYVGVYVLMEKVKRSPGRIDIAKLLPHHDRPPHITGGYLLRIDRLDPGDSGFTAGGYEIGFGEPKEADVTPSQLEWITHHLNTFNAVLQGASFDHPVAGYRRFINTESWIHHHLVNVLAKNVDALRLSTFLYKDRGGKLEMGPVWDFDLSMDSPDSRDNDPQTMRGGGDATNYFDVHWWNRLFEDPRFRREYHRRWSDLRGGALSNANIKSSIDSMAHELREAQARNFERWPLSFPHGSWEGEISHVKRWLVTRANWLDTRFLPVPSIDAGVDFDTATATITVTFDDDETLGGDVFYTLNGSDPRGSRSKPAEDALLYDGSFVIDGDAPIHVRLRIGESWSQISRKSVSVEHSTFEIGETHSQSPGPTPEQDVPLVNGQLPGDSNQDARVDLSDALHFAKSLFVGDSRGFPCANAAANRILLDVNNDRSLDGSDVVGLLIYLFLDGPPPARGTGCIEIEGCAAVCGR